MAVTRFKFITGNCQGWEISWFYLVEIRIQRHLLFTGRNLPYWTTYILKSRDSQLDLYISNDKLH